MKQLVSILIPAYNAEKWIGMTIESAIKQTWPNKEIIIVDDGSTDKTLSIIKKYESPTIKIISQQNKGASAARNTALEQAQGDWIQWLDSDDILAQDKIEKQIKKANIYNSDEILYSSAFGLFYYNYKKSKFYPDNLWQDLKPVEWMIIKFRDNLWMSMNAWLISRNLINVAGKWNENLSLNDDGEYVCRIISACKEIIFVKEACSYCRISNINSLSSQRSYEACASQYLSHKYCIKKLCDMENSERTRNASLNSLQECLLHYYYDYPDLKEKVFKLAKELGGELHDPNLRRECRYIQKVLGLSAALKMQKTLPKLKKIVYKNYDRLLYMLSN